MWWKNRTVLILPDSNYTQQKKVNQTNIYYAEISGDIAFVTQKHDNIYIPFLAGYSLV